MRDFLISYTGADETWAEWIAWELFALGYKAVMQRWHFGPGSNFVYEMNAAVAECRRLLLVLSKSSLEAPFVTSEWAAFFNKDPDGRKRLVVPVRVDDCRPAGLLSQIVHIDLTGLTSTEARRALTQGIGHTSRVPKKRPVFPGLAASTDCLAPIFPSRPEVHSAEYLEELANLFPLATEVRLPSIKERPIGRAFITKLLPHLVARQMASGLPISAITVDIDGMGAISSKFGYDVGDSVIRKLLCYCEDITKGIVTIRIGDDTILTLLRNADENAACRLANQLVKTVRTADWNSLATGLFVTCSAGVAVFSSDEPSELSLARAVEGHQLARRLGGNKVRRTPIGPKIKAERRRLEVLWTELDS